MTKWNEAAYFEVFSEGLRKTTKNFSEDNWRPDWDSNRKPPKYESKTLSLDHSLRFLPFMGPLKFITIFTRGNQWPQ
jgi:hypothetical protein